MFCNGFLKDLKEYLEKFNDYFNSVIKEMILEPNIPIDHPLLKDIIMSILYVVVTGK